MKVARSRPTRRRKTYHHGDLRRAMVAAALAVLEREGAASLSLRGVARSAGVSQAAPYNHFRDKDALLAAVAAEGFRALAAETIEARDRAADAPGRMLAIGQAYIRFAVRRPELFRLMFGPAGADYAGHPELGEAARASYAVLGATMEGGGRSTDPADRLAAWAIVHGLATLLIDRRVSIPDAALDATIGQVLRRARLGVSPRVIAEAE